MIKWKIRLLFNPRSKNIDISKVLTNENLEKAIIQKFWIPEISQDHVIHASDSEAEFNHILKAFNLDLKKSKDYFHNIFPSNLPILKVEINSLLANTCEEQEIQIENTPHFKYLLGEKEQYRNYILKYLGTIIKDDHLPEKYDLLIQNFNYGKLVKNMPSYIIVKNHPKLKNKYIIIDGLHRACILKKNKNEIINVYLTSNDTI